MCGILLENMAEIGEGCRYLSEMHAQPHRATVQAGEVHARLLSCFAYGARISAGRVSSNISRFG